MNKFGLDKVLENMGSMKQTLPPKLANQAQNEFVDNFKKQGFDSKGWKEVQRRTPGTKAYKYPKNKGLSRRTKQILVGTGRLRRIVSNCIRQATFNRIRLVIDTPYAAVHNEGTENVDQRQYVGQTNSLTKKQLDLITDEVDKNWK